MLSIIVCSNKDDEYFHNFTANLQDTVGVPFEVIQIDNSKNKHSIFSAYNLGASRVQCLTCVSCTKTLNSTQKLGQQANYTSLRP